MNALGNPSTVQSFVPVCIFGKHKIHKNTKNVRLVLEDSAISVRFWDWFRLGWAGVRLGWAGSAKVSDCIFGNSDTRTRVSPTRLERGDMSADKPKGAEAER